MEMVGRSGSFEAMRMASAAGVQPAGAVRILPGGAGERRRPVAQYKVGDHVTWNSEAGRVSGTIIKIHERDFEYKGYNHHASKEEPQYEIKSDKTDHIAAHKESALKKSG
jgi:hypothetical protein